MFWASSCPSSGAYKPQEPPSVYCWNVVVARPRSQPTTLLPPRSNGKLKAATAVYKLLMMGMRIPETCWAVFKRRTINPIDWCFWLINLFKWVYFMPYYYFGDTLWCSQVWPKHVSYCRYVITYILPKYIRFFNICHNLMHGVRGV
jgi:hypothetical protein